MTRDRAPIILLIDEGIHFEDQVTFAAGLLVLDFASDRCSKACRRDTGATRSLRYSKFGRVSGQEVKKVGTVGANRGRR